MAYLAVLGASRGRLAGFSAVLGVALGLALLGVAVGLGGGSLILNNRLAYESLRWAGALYLCWLAFDSWQEARRPDRDAPRSASLASCIFAAGLSPTCSIRRPRCSSSPWFRNSSRARRPAARELAILIAIYVAVATLVHGLIVVLAGGLQTFLAAPQRREMAGNIFAVLLLASPSGCS